MGSVSDGTVGTPGWPVIQAMRKKARGKSPDLYPRAMFLIGLVLRPGLAVHLYRPFPMCKAGAKPGGHTRMSSRRRISGRVRGGGQMLRGWGFVPRWPPDAGRQVSMGEQRQGDMAKPAGPAAHLADLTFGDLDGPTRPGNLYQLGQSRRLRHRHVRVFIKC